MNQPSEGGVAEFSVAEPAPLDGPVLDSLTQKATLTVVPGAAGQGHAGEIRAAIVDGDRTPPLTIRTATVLQRLEKGAANILPAVDRLVDEVRSEIGRLNASIPNDARQKEAHSAFTSLLRGLLDRLLNLRQEIAFAIEHVGQPTEKVFRGRAAAIAEAIEDAIVQDFSQNGPKYVSMFIKGGIYLAGAYAASELGIGNALLQTIGKMFKS